MSPNGNEMGRSITKAMVLAAGFGTRLRPLTYETPKSMLPVQGKPLIDYVLARLAAAGVREVMINLHHLPEAIREYVGTGDKFGLKADFSFEPEILGTGGGLKNVESFFGDAPFFLINADTLIDLDLKALAEHHAALPEAAATLVVRRLPPRATYTPLRIATDGKLLEFGSGEHHYVGLMVGTKAVLDELPADKPSCLVTHGLKPLLSEGWRIDTMEHHGYWNDVGTPERYHEAQESAGRLKL